MSATATEDHPTFYRLLFRLAHYQPAILVVPAILDVLRHYWPAWPLHVGYAMTLAFYPVLPGAGDEHSRRPRRRRRSWPACFLATAMPVPPCAATQSAARPEVSR
jgi:hypothetical protein